MVNLVSARVYAHLWLPVVHLLLRWASPISVYCLATSFLIVLGTIAIRRAPRKKIRLTVLLRAIFPRRFFTSRSSRLDAVLFVGSIFLFTAVLGWAVGSSGFISSAVTRTLVSYLGVAHPRPVGFAERAAVTVVLFLVYDLAYWTNHYVAHKVPFLWEFHKIHHTAQVLTPLTNWRVHPVYTIIYSWFTAVFVGVADGALKYAVGPGAMPLGPEGMNVVLLLFFLTTVSLQHSHIWIATNGLLGRAVVSPAHHQIHHSADRRHFDKNFGLCLAVWDWMAGTLYVPEPKRESLTYGVPAGGPDPHTLRGALVAPFVLAAQSIPLMARRAFRLPKPKTETPAL